jgi:TPR repeat protein
MTPPGRSGSSLFSEPSRLDSHEIWKSLFLPAEADVALLELRRRARAQDPEAQWLLANWMSLGPTGYGVHTRQSATWLLRAARNGFGPAFVEAGAYLTSRPHSASAAALARRYYLRAHARGDAFGAWALALDAEAQFDRRTARVRAAYEWFCRAADRLPSLGWKPGEYVVAGLAPRQASAKGLRLLALAARCGSAEAEFYLGLRSYLGCGCRVDRERAARWFERSASNRNATSTDSGEAAAHAMLGRQLAFSGKTRRQGLRHLAAAAEAGLPMAHADHALAELAAGQAWSRCRKRLARSVELYAGPWRRPGGVWIGIERLTLSRIRLAAELIGSPSVPSSPCVHVTRRFDLDA